MKRELDCYQMAACTQDDVTTTTALVPMTLRRWLQRATSGVVLLMVMLLTTMFLFASPHVPLLSVKCRAWLQEAQHRESFPVQPMFLHGTSVPHFAKSCRVRRNPCDAPERLRRVHIITLTASCAHTSVARRTIARQHLMLRLPARQRRLLLRPSSKKIRASTSIQFVT